MCNVRRAPKGSRPGRPAAVLSCFLAIVVAGLLQVRRAGAQASAPPAEPAPSGPPPPAAPPPPASAPPASAPPANAPPPYAPPTYAPPPAPPGTPAAPYGPAPPAYAVYPYAPARPPPHAPDAHTHSGFFLRMSAGAGFMADGVSLAGAGFAGEVTIKGPAATFEIDVGGSLVPGFSLSGAFLLHAIANPVLSNDTRTFTDGAGVTTSSQLDETPQLSVLGLQADLYPNPAQGFHAGGIVGFATMQARRSGDSNGSSDGFAIAPHAGYEWWFGDYWGLGVLGRILYARTHSSYSDGRQTDKVVTVTVSFSATYN